MKKRWIGLGLLALVVLVAVGYSAFIGTKPARATLSGLLGGEKIGLFEDEAFRELLEKEHGLRMDYRKAGSLAMVQGDSGDRDYLFPSSQLALEIYKERGGSYEDQDIVFNTPIVLYSRRAVVDALMAQNLASESDGVYYVDMKALAEKIAAGTSWADLGMPTLYGNVFVDTTDPNQSNSGNMFLGLLASSLYGGPLRGEAAQSVVEPVRKIYNEIGYMQSSSSDMFSQFMKQGMGAYPMIAGYENQILEFSRTDPDIYERIKDDIIILYPSPTVWSSHVYIALTEEGKRGLDALKTEEVQDIAWKRHGFRTMAAGSADKKRFDVPGIATQIDRVMPMPDKKAMDILMKGIQ
ncbi:hypothetical protein QO008_000829 [Peptoniphilus ivorii]|uniref:hypothetical protein n=1 Tax=Aedoeadaptatus ivorii TaxID=54006 RepID=UPI00278813C1|nr:hypothetical protein [Peptoniphilus ivorii]MDQ0508374.1 hypothetical protein [Peptoniphilus ivorii]